MTVPLFVFGTLLHPPLLHIVAGEGAHIAQPAYLPDHAVVWVAGASYPMLIARKGARAEGLMITLSDAALARLDGYEACFDYHRAPLTVHTGDGPQLAEAWRPTDTVGRPGADWSLHDWADVWGSLTTTAATEVMRQLETDDPESIGARFWMIRARAQAYVSAQSWQRPRLVGSDLTAEDVTVERRKHPYDRFFSVEELRLRARRFDGSQSPVQHRAVFRVADAVTVLPYDPVRDRILMVEQLRFGALVHGDANPWILEPVAGMIDAGETPETAARRETMEEAGITLGDLHFVGKYYPSPGGLAQLLISYVALADLPDDAAQIGGHVAEGEDILSHVVPFDLALRMLDEGDMTNAPMITSVQWLQINRDRLRAAVGI